MMSYWRSRTIDEQGRIGGIPLNFEDESVLSQLPPLTAHEKLELRLSLPREFWPQKWADTGLADSEKS
jgi:hypothetical protein